MNSDVIIENVDDVQNFQKFMKFWKEIHKWLIVDFKNLYRNLKRFKALFKFNLRNFSRLKFFVPYALRLMFLSAYVEFPTPYFICSLRSTAQYSLHFTFDISFWSLSTPNFPNLNFFHVAFLLIFYLYFPPPSHLIFRLSLTINYLQFY